MPLFKYVGYYGRMYGGIKTADGRDLYVEQGWVVDLPVDKVPQDGMWIPAETENAPVTAPETPPVPVPEPVPVNVPDPAPVSPEPVEAPPAPAVAAPQYVNPNTQPPAVVH